MYDIFSAPCDASKLPSLDDPWLRMMSAEVSRHGEMEQSYRGEVDRGASGGWFAADRPGRFGLVGARHVLDIGCLKAVNRMERHERGFLYLHPSRDGRAA